MLETLLQVPFLGRLNPYFLAAWSVLVLYWLGRIAWQARSGRVPAVHWWSVPGLLLLPLAPLTEVPPLFGVGAALLLLGEWWPRNFRFGRRRPPWAWALLAALTGSALLASPPTFLSLLAGLGLGLWAAGTLVGALFWRPRPRRSGWLPAGLFKEDAAVPTFGQEVRWRPAQQPDPPELSVTLGRGGALELTNDTASVLWLRGWSPGHHNIFRALDRPLAPGATLRLHRDREQRGVRVWYSPAQHRDVVLILRADWRPDAPTDGPPRWLN